MIKKITLIAALFVLKSLNAQILTYNWVNATTRNTNGITQIQETVNGFTVTFTGAPNATIIRDSNPFNNKLLSTGVFSQTAVDTFTFAFDKPIDLNSLRFTITTGDHRLITLSTVILNNDGTLSSGQEQTISNSAPGEINVPFQALTSLNNKRVVLLTIKTINNSIIEFDSLSFTEGSSTLSTKDITLESNLKVYPNPVKNNLHIDYSLPIESVEIFNILGKLVHTGINKDIDFTNYINGVYFIKIRTEKGIITKKIIKK